MHPGTFWLIYALPAYVLWTLAFPLRYGFWPVAGRLPPRNLYASVDFLLGVVLIAYSVWIVFGPPPDPAKIISIRAGIGIWSSGVLLRWWAVYTLGPHWRIGHDETDTRTEFIATGPYRIVHHPINAALILVAIGQALMTGLDGRALFLLVASVAYFLIQGRAEDALWKKRKSHSANKKLSS